MATDTTLLTKTKVQRLTELGMNFVENQIELAKLSIAETAVKSSKKLLSLAIVGVFSFFMVVFLSFGAAYWIGRYLNNTASGFFIVAAVYLVIMVLALIIVKPLITNQITKSIIDTLDNENER
jgi:Putative Actinobacterial Holin-X, holin superfamily III